MESGSRTRDRGISKVQRSPKVVKAVMPRVNQLLDVEQSNVIQGSVRTGGDPEMTLLMSPKILKMPTAVVHRSLSVVHHQDFLEVVVTMMMILEMMMVPLLTRGLMKRIHQ